MSKSELIQKNRRKDLKKAGPFFVPGFAKFVVIKKPATKARKGINRFTNKCAVAEEGSSMMVSPMKNFLLIFAAVISVTSDATPAAAQRFGQYPWCSSTGYSSCSFDTYSQCMDTARGLSGHCYQNPAYECARRRY
jgi:Protein of unknown function (DUF3551)